MFSTRKVSCKCEWGRRIMHCLEVLCWKFFCLLSMHVQVSSSKVLQFETLSLFPHSFNKCVSTNILGREKAIIVSKWNVATGCLHGLSISALKGNNKRGYVGGEEDGGVPPLSTETTGRSTYRDLAAHDKQQPLSSASVLHEFIPPIQGPVQTPLLSRGNKFIVLSYTGFCPYHSTKTEGSLRPLWRKGLLSSWWSVVSPVLSQLPWLYRFSASF